jgi:uncharacterized membrane protein YdbT with pleckstrin-like domain
MAYVDELLGHGEQILYVAKQHMIVLISRILTGLVLIGVLVAAGVASSRAFSANANIEIAGISLAINGQQILFAAFIISVLVLLSIFSSFLRWNAEEYIITDRRVIQIRGLLSKAVIDSSLGKINDVILRQSVLGRMLNFGTIEIVTASDEVTSSIDSVSAPLEFKRAMMDARYNYERGYGYLDAQYAAQNSQDLSFPAEFEIHRTLEELARLRDRGILSPEEFESKKRELLSRI